MRIRVGMIGNTSRVYRGRMAGVHSCIAVGLGVMVSYTVPRERCVAGKVGRASEESGPTHPLADKIGVLSPDGGGDAVWGVCEVGTTAQERPEGQHSTL